MTDRFSLELERTIFNWYYGGGNAAPEPVFNALHAGLDNDMQVIVPIETLEEMLQMMGDPKKVKVGDTFSNDEPIAIRFRHLVVNEDDK